MEVIDQGFVEVPVCRNRPENIVDYVTINAEFAPALVKLKLDWWYLGDLCAQKRGYVPYRSFRRSIPREWTGLPVDGKSKEYNLLLHRVIAVGIKFGEIPLSFAELVDKIGRIGVVKVTNPWDYTRECLEIERGTGTSSQASPGIKFSPVNQRSVVKPPPVTQEQLLEEKVGLAVSDVNEVLPACLFGGGEIEVVNHDQEDARARALAEQQVVKQIDDILSKLV
jgi:hypothetical protein